MHQSSQAIILFVSMLLHTMAPALAETQTAIFAGGCFWCVEAAFEEVDGVESAISGFTGGTLPDPTYDGNHEGHYEAVAVTFDPNIVSYAKLLDRFWKNIDPFDANGQFCDRGHSYQSAIFVVDESQRQLATESKQHIQSLFEDTTVVTEILPAGRFYPVKEYHQDYYRKNPLRYRFYRAGCRRDHRLEEIWGDQAGGTH